MRFKTSQKGRVSLGEMLLVVVYALACIGCFGLGSIDLQWVTDFAPYIVVVSVLGVFALDKQNKKSQITLMEVACIFVAIALPLAGAGYLSSLGVDISQYLADATSKFILFLVSVGALVIAGRQD